MPTATPNSPVLLRYRPEWKNSDILDFRAQGLFFSKPTQFLKYKLVAEI